MDIVFWLRVCLSVIVTGASVAAFTAIAETRGSRLGGLLLTIPVKVTLALVFIGLSESAAFAADAARAVPAGIAANVVFLTVCVFLLRVTRPGPAVFFAYLAWIVVAILVLFLRPPGPALGLLYWLVAAVLATFLLQRLTVLRPIVRGSRGRSHPLALLRRAFYAGLLVGVALVVARTLGSTLAGLVSVFPSSWLIAMYILARDQGPDLAGATGRVMVLGSAAPAVYGAVAAAVFAALGVLWGTLAAFGAAVLTTLLAALVLEGLGGSARSPKPR